MDLLGIPAQFARQVVATIMHLGDVLALVGGAALPFSNGG